MIKLSFYLVPIQASSHHISLITAHTIPQKSQMPCRLSKSKTAVWPSRVAIFLASFTSALCFTSSSATSTWLSCTAAHSGVAPSSGLAWFGSALCARSAVATSTWPFSAAVNSGVDPFCAAINSVVAPSSGYYVFKIFLYILLSFVLGQSSVAETKSLVYVHLA